jgi:hypothetical protein
VSGKSLVASLIWDPNSQLHQVLADVFESLGYQHEYFLWDEKLPDECDYVFIMGPYGSYVPFIRRLCEIPADKRPVVVYWFDQNLMLDFPPGILWLLRKNFSDLESLYRPRIFQNARKALLRVFRGRGSRFASLGDILWMKENHFLDMLGVIASYYADYFQKRGIEAVLIPRGYHSSYGKLLNLERDIAVTWMGKIRNKKREHVILGIQDQLSRMGLKMHVYDNVHLPFIFGEKRTEIINRSWFMLNVLAYPADEISIRYYIAGANGAVVLTEPGKNKYPFENGKHLVECPVSEMADKVDYYIKHSDEWQKISTAMLEWMRTEVTLEKSIATLMQKAEHEKENRTIHHHKSNKTIDVEI